MVATADAVGLPAAPGFRSTFVAYLEWRTRIAVINSQPDAAVIEHAPVPLWGWGQTPAARRTSTRALNGTKVVCERACNGLVR